MRSVLRLLADLSAQASSQKTVYPLLWSGQSSFPSLCSGLVGQADPMFTGSYPSLHPQSSSQEPTSSSKPV